MKKDAIQWEPKKVKVDDLIENPKNPKTLNETGKKRLQKSLSKFGLAGTIICNSDLTIIDGHSRKTELLAAGIEEVYVSVPSRALTDQEYKEFNAIIDLAQAGDPNFVMMEEIFQDEFFEEWELDQSGELAFNAEPDSVKRNIDKINAIKANRKKGNESIQDKSDTEKYLVITFPTREEKIKLLESLNLPGDERYLPSGAVQIRLTGKWRTAARSAKRNKSGATG
jgi:hypothetical protein